MQIAWEMASTVFSHSRLAEERSSTRRAFSSAIAAWASTAETSVSSAFPSTPGRSLDRETARSEEHTSELQSPYDLVCRLLLEKKKKKRLLSNLLTLVNGHEIANRINLVNVQYLQYPHSLRTYTVYGIIAPILHICNYLDHTVQ